MKNKEVKGKKGFFVDRMSLKTKWTITGLLCVFAVLTVIFCFASGVFHFEPGSVKANDEEVEATPSPTPEEEDTDVPTQRYSVFVSSSSGGTVSPNGNNMVNEWESLTVSVTPDEGYIISSVTVDGTEVGAVGSYTFDYVSENHSLVATFEKEPEPSPSPSPEIEEGEEEDEGSLIEKAIGSLFGF